jgi:ABC-2 type transport system permease protein
VTTAQHTARPVVSPDRANPLRAAITLRERPRRPGPLSTSLTFAWRALLKIKHVPEQLFDVTITPVMFTLLFTYLFGGAIAGGVSAYVQYVLPGILVQMVLFVTVYTGFTLNTDMTKGVFDRFRSLPVWRPSPVVGALLGDTVRYSVASVITLAIGFAIGFRADGGALGVLAGVVILLVFACAITWVFTALGLAVRSPNAVMAVAWIVTAPLTFASNTYVDPETMPGWLETIVDANPVSHLVTAVRGFIAGDPAWEQVGWVLVASVVVTVIAAPVTMHLYRTRT